MSGRAVRLSRGCAERRWLRGALTGSPLAPVSPLLPGAPGSPWERGGETLRTAWVGAGGVLSPPTPGAGSSQCRGGAEMTPRGAAHRRTKGWSRPTAAQRPISVPAPEGRAAPPPQGWGGGGEGGWDAEGLTLFPLGPGAPLGPWGPEGPRAPGKPGAPAMPGAPCGTGRGAVRPRGPPPPKPRAAVRRRTDHSP